MASKAWNDAVKIYLKTIGAKGGKSRSAKKLKALAQARKLRWKGKK